MIDTPVVAALDMYVEPDCVRQAGATFIGEACRRLGVRRYAPAAADLAVQWRQPNLLFAQTCGYPLMTQLRGQVAVLAVPATTCPIALPASIAVCSSPPKRQARQRLGDFRNTRLALNDRDSNSGMNLLRHALAPLGRDSAFFAEVRISGGHLRSLAMVAAGEVELTSVDAVTFGYLQRHAPERLAGLRVLGRSAPSPALPLITSLHWSAAQRRELFGSAEPDADRVPAPGRDTGAEKLPPGRRGALPDSPRLRASGAGLGLPAIALNGVTEGPKPVRARFDHVHPRPFRQAPSPGERLPSLILNSRKINVLNEIHGGVQISPEGVTAELALPLLILVCTSIDVFGRPSPTSASSPNSGAPRGRRPLNATPRSLP
ncbi:PhnD/SsuA/transferrin family substrate-binding protein [Pseudomonas aeruginosa]|nr:PhnD/SsuA/transferrin family substrate-binding protein [Pseudomonas aeruginosa]